MNIKIVGLGGIGGWLVEPLCVHLSNSEKEQYHITLIDGDAFENKNRSRQRFTKLENKAISTCERLKEQQSQNVQLAAKALYITQDNVIRYIREDDVIFLCVDNHATRKIVSDRCKELNNVTLISGGNELTDGNVIFYVRKNGKDVGKPLTELFPEIANPEDFVPGTNIGCEALIASDPQLVFTNNMAAALMLNTFYAFEEGKIDFEQVYFDIKTLGVRKTPEKQVQTLSFEE